MVAWTDHPQAADLYLYLLKPDVVFAAQVNMSGSHAPIYPVSVIQYDTVTTGSHSDIEFGMTVLIGSTPGAYDLGRTYVRRDWDGFVADGAFIHCGFCSQGRSRGTVDLQDDAYITILDLYEEWMRPAQIDQGIIFKDADLIFEVSNGPVACTGGRGGMAILDYVDANTGVLAVDDWDASASFTNADGESIDTLAWEMRDGTYTSGSSSDPNPDTTFPPGHRWIRLDATDTAGTASIPRRVLVVALDDSTESPLTRVSNAQWRRAPEGVTFQADLRERLDPADTVPGTVVIALVRMTYNGVAAALGSGGYEIAFSGWLDYQTSFGQANQYDFERGTTIYARDIAQRDKLLTVPASTLGRASSPASYNDLKDADLDRYLWERLFWHSFALAFGDFTPSGTSAYTFSSFSNPGGSLYDVADALAKAFARRYTCDSRNRLAVLPDPMRQDSNDRTSTVLASIGSADIVRVDRMQKQPGTGLLDVAVTLASTVNAASLSTPVTDTQVVAPGTSEGQGAGVQQNQYRWLAASATEAAERAGHDFARLNADENTLKITLAHGGDVGLEPARMAWVEVTIDADTVGWGDVELTNERCLLLATNFTYNDHDNAITQSIEVERETVGTIGKVIPPGATPTPVVTDPGSSQTPILPTNPTTSNNYGLSRGAATLYAFDSTNGVVWQYDKASGLWTQVIDLVALGMGGTLVDATWRVGGNIARILTTTEVRRLNNYSSGTPALGTAHSFPETCVSRQIQFEREVIDWGIIVSYVIGSGIRIDWTNDDLATVSRVSPGGVFDNTDTNTGNKPFAGLWLDPHVPGHALISVFSNNATPPTSTAAVYETTDYGASWHAFSGSTQTLGHWLANMIVVGYLDVGAANIYHAESFTTGSGQFRLFRNTTDVSVEYPVGSGTFYGYVQGGRCLSIADDDPHTAIACMAAVANSSTVGLAVTHNDGASWTWLVEPSSSFNGRNCYMVDHQSAYIVGESGYVAYWDGTQVYDISISGGGTIVALMGP